MLYEVHGLLGHGQKKGFLKKKKWSERVKGNYGKPCLRVGFKNGGGMAAAYVLA